MDFIRVSRPAEGTARRLVRPDVFRFPRAPSGTEYVMVDASSLAVIGYFVRRSQGPGRAVGPYGGA